MSNVLQISHSEYDPRYNGVSSSRAPDSLVQRLFHDVPALSSDPDSMIRRGRLILRAQTQGATIRQGHYNRYKGILDQDNVLGNLPFSPKHIPRNALRVFIGAVQDRGDELNEHLLATDAKGVSAELGHVEQFGDWDIDKDLTSAVESLTRTSMIQESGATFTKIYDRLNPQDVHYKIKLTDDPNVTSFTPEIDDPAVTVFRTRPVADLRVNTSNGKKQDIQIVKRSIFALDTKSLDDVGHVIIQSHLKNAEKQKGITAEVVGRGIVERAIEMRRKDIFPTEVFPAESLYFAILRKKTTLS